MEQSNDKNQGIPLSIANRLFEYRCQLDLANEIIKLLEQQRSLCRAKFDNCKCFINNKDKTVNNDTSNKYQFEINQYEYLNNKLQSLYRKRYDPESSLIDNNYSNVKLINWFDHKSNHNRMLGIDMKTLINQNVDSESDLNQKKKKQCKPGSSSKKKFRCTIEKKCRFSCQSERRLMHHQIKHRREKFLHFIQPYGLTLSTDCCKVIEISPTSDNVNVKKIQSGYCPLPFCSFKYSANDSDWKSKLSSHFEETHLSVYMMHPCFKCKRMFKTKNDLKKHFNQSIKCSEQKQMPNSAFESSSKPQESDQIQPINDPVINIDDDDDDDASGSIVDDLIHYLDDDNIGLEVFIENNTTNTLEESASTNTNDLNFDEFFTATNEVELNQTSANDDDENAAILTSPDKDHNYNIGPPPISSASFMYDHDDYAKSIDDDDQYRILFESTSSESIDETQSADISTAISSTNDSNEKNDNEQQRLKQLFNLYIFECTKCSFSFQSERELSLHYYLVHNLPSFNCDDCEFVTQDIDKYNQHIRLHNEKQQSDNPEIDISICSICSQTFPNDSYLKAHQTIEHQTCRCEYCDITLINRSMWRSHMQSFHLNKLNKCSKCSYKSFDTKLYERHCQKHLQSKCCTYPGCNDEFANDDCLESHVNRIHRNTRPYKCDTCAEKFYSSLTLNKHLVNVHKKLIFSCSQCPFRTCQQSRLNKHQLCHSSIKPFECVVQGCYQRFCSRYQLISHQKHKHCQRKDFNCNHCEKQFKTNQQLNYHVRSTHSNLKDSNPITNEINCDNDANENNDLTKKPNITFYVYCGGSLRVNNGQLFPSSMNISNNTVKNVNEKLSLKSIIIKRSLIPKKSAPLSTTTIAPITEESGQESIIIE